MTELLPGILVNEVKMYELQVGDKVYDRTLDLKGYIEEISALGEFAIIRFVDKSSQYMDTLPYCVFLERPKKRTLK